MMFHMIFSLFSNRIFGKKRINILIYHRVLEKKDPLHDDIVTKEEFDEQMSWVANYFNVMTLREAYELDRENRLPRRALAITFDDGYKDNLTLAVPILKKHGLRATFFIATDYLHHTPKWDYLTEAIRFSKRDNIELMGESYSLTSIAHKAAFARIAPERIKTHEQDVGDEILKNLIEQLGPVKVEGLMMNERDLREMTEAGMEIGGHGDKHHIMSRVSDDVAKQEVLDSKRKLEQLSGQLVEGFAFPNGLYPVDFNDNHCRMVEEGGYKYACSTNIGCSAFTEQTYSLKRYTPWRRNKIGFLAEMAVNYWR